MNMFEQLKDDSYWREINADKTAEDLHTELLELVEKNVKSSATKDIGKLW